MISKPLGFIKPASIACAVAAVVGAIVMGILRGWPGALGFLAGVALVMVSYVISTLIIYWTDKVNPKLLLVTGLATYTIKFALLFLLVGWVTRTGWDGRVPMAIGVLVGVLAWTGAQVWWTYKGRFTLEV
ncbi:hypothetical protein [Hamadaea tsunoensis]|uniref:hypothetical protein n=1 Tax=Hamadaea tsunoensis TaxID=53368 RepID=UPI000424DE93|nr:hypothetical protein [Hamadaea tsunoensis]